MRTTELGLIMNEVLMMLDEYCGAKIDGRDAQIACRRNETGDGVKVANAIATGQLSAYADIRRILAALKWQAELSALEA